MINFDSLLKTALRIAKYDLKDSVYNDHKIMKLNL